VLVDQHSDSGPAVRGAVQGHYTGQYGPFMAFLIILDDMFQFVGHSIMFFVGWKGTRLPVSRLLLGGIRTKPSTLARPIKSPEPLLESVLANREPIPISMRAATKRVSSVGVETGALKDTLNSGVCRPRILLSQGTKYIQWHTKVDTGFPGKENIRQSRSWWFPNQKGFPGRWATLSKIPGTPNCSKISGKKPNFPTATPPPRILTA